MNKINEIFKLQQIYKKQHATCDMFTLKKQLQLLLDICLQHEQDISMALYQDLHKNATEVYLSEFIPVVHEIKWFIKRLSKIHTLHNTTKLSQIFMYKNYEKYKAHGNVIIYSTYNYPFQLSMIPLIGAIACNNTVVLKMSEYTPHTNKIITEILSKVFTPQQCYVVDLKDDVNHLYATLYALQVDMVFFTGSNTIGKKIYENYAKQLIPVVLELGGKSPVIIEPSCYLRQAAKRIVWAKMMNCGQTCVAPDYIIIHETLLTQFIELFKQEFSNQYTNKNIIKDLAFCLDHQKVKCQKLLEQQVIYWSHPLDKSLSIALTQFSSFNDPIWQEEIFGPLLPIVTYKNNSEIDLIVSHNANPLALYVFSNNKQFINDIYNNINAGSVAINDCIMHLNSPMPFGGVRASGIGQYHGYASINCFMRIQPLVKCTKTDFDARYAPTSVKKLKFLKKFVK